ncbi:MAG: hypothetical protein ACRDPC_06610 [Solirubrobacteraceae bacterium]
MPHLKCVTCRTRLYSARDAAGVCDGCGSPLEPAGELTELVGYRRATQARPGVDLWPDEGIAAAVSLPVPVWPPTTRS